MPRDKAGSAFSRRREKKRRREREEKKKKKREERREVEAWIFHAVDSHAGRAFFARYRNSKERTAVVRESDPNGLIVAAAAAAGSSPRASIAAVCK